MEVTGWLIQHLETASICTELAFISFRSTSVPPSVCAENYFNKIISQELKWNVFLESRWSPLDCLMRRRYLMTLTDYVSKGQSEIFSPTKSKKNFSKKWPIDRDGSGESTARMGTLIRSKPLVSYKTRAN